jgi:hypothetical protein
MDKDGHFSRSAVRAEYRVPHYPAFGYEDKIRVSAQRIEPALKTDTARRQAEGSRFGFKAAVHYYQFLTVRLRAAPQLNALVNSRSLEHSHTDSSRFPPHRSDRVQPGLHDKRFPGS